MVRTTVLLWILAPCGLLVAGLGDMDRAPVGMPDNEFVVSAMSIQRFEVEADGRAYAQGADKSVIRCGAQLASDYRSACTDLAALATLKGWMIPDNLRENEQLMLDELTVLEGEEFDQEFAKRMERWHRDALILFERATGPDGVQDDELRQWAADKLSMLRYEPVYHSVQVA